MKQSDALLKIHLSQCLAMLLTDLFYDIFKCGVVDKNKNVPCSQQRLQTTTRSRHPLLRIFISYRDEIAKKELHSGGDQMND